MPAPLLQNVAKPVGMIRMHVREERALICAPGTFSCDSRIPVPRPASNCSLRALQL